MTISENITESRFRRMLELYATSASRTNLRYEVLYKENDDEKYTALRDLIETRSCPTIVYVSRTKRTSDIQREIISDTTQYIVVTAGPRSGKTRVLVHKFASLMLPEDVKHEQLLNGYTS